MQLIARKREQNFLQTSIAVRTGTRRVIWITGPAGMGKSALLFWFKETCIRLGLPTFAVELEGRTWEESLDLLARKIETYDSVEGGAEQTLTKLEAEDFSSLPLFANLANSIGNQPPPESTFMRLQHGLKSLADYTLPVVCIDAGVTTELQKTLGYEDTLSFIPEGVLVVIAVRRLPPMNRQTSTTIKVDTLPLMAFDDDAIHDYFDAAGIHVEIPETLLAATNGIPLLLEVISHSYVSPLSLELTVLELHQQLVDRTLAEVKDARVHELIRFAAIYRQFNVEALQRLSKSHHLDDYFDSLRHLSFISSKEELLSVVPDVRVRILALWKAQAPSRFVELNQKALSYVTALAHRQNKLSSSSWHIEMLYHMLTNDVNEGIGLGIRLFLEGEILVDVDTCRNVVNTLIEQKSNAPLLSDWIELFNSRLLILYEQWERAKVECERIVQATVSPRLNAHARAALGNALKIVGNWKGCELILSEAGDVLHSLGDKMTAVLVLIALAEVYSNQHQWINAERTLGKVEPYLKNLASRPLKFRYYLMRAALMRAKGQWEVSYNQLNQAMALAEELKSVYLQSEVLQNRGKLFRARQDWNKAIDCYKQAIAMIEQLPFHLLLAQYLHSLGNVYLRIDRLDDAEPLIRRSLELKEQAHDTFGVAKSLNALAHIARLRGERDTALDKYIKSAELFREVANSNKVGRVLCRIGMMFAEQAQLGQAVEYLEASLKVRLDIKDRQGVAESLYELGLVQISRDELDLATDSFSRSLQYAEGSESLTRQIAPSVQLAVIRYRAGDVTQGTKHLLTAREVAFKSKQYGLLRQLYREQAKTEARTERFLTAFQCYAESAYASAFESGQTLVELIHEIHGLIEQVAVKQGETYAAEFARKLLAFWLKYCPVPSVTSGTWDYIVSPEAEVASTSASKALRFFRNIANR